MLVRGSETVCDVRGVLILHEDVAELAVAVSSAGKKKKLLFFLAKTVRWTGWLCCWAGPVLGFGRRGTGLTRWCWSWAAAAC
jgi:hypothetical protein